MATYFPETVVLQTSAIRSFTKPTYFCRRSFSEVSASLASVPCVTRSDSFRGGPPETHGSCAGCLEEGKKHVHLSFQRRDNSQSFDVGVFSRKSKSFCSSNGRVVSAVGAVSGGETESEYADARGEFGGRDRYGRFVETHDTAHVQGSGRGRNNAGRRTGDGYDIEYSADVEFDEELTADEMSGNSAVDEYDLSLARFETASVSQALSSPLGRRLTSSVGSMARTAPRLPRLTMTGSTGFLMAVAVTVAGITSAVRSHMHHTREWWMKHVCARCDGYGVECCHVCNGVGEIRWEGKLTHTDPCPGCLGDGYRKCRQCLGGCNFKKGLPPALEQTLSSRNRM